MILNDTVGNNKKNFFCRDQYWQLINSQYGENVFRSINGARLRKCTFGENCRGAHSGEEINLLPANYQFKKSDKSKIDLVKIYLEICQVFELEKSKVLEPDFKTKIQNYSSFNFIELINFWYDITCYHRKIKKNYESVENNYYKNRANIPDFYLENEDIVWPLERITKKCPKYKSLINCIECESQKPTIWDICCGSINCKEGCHHESNMICNDNLLTGSCDCISLEEFNENYSKIEEEIKNCEDTINDKNFVISNKKRKSITNKIKKLKSQLSSMYRKIHLTEEGLIHFEVAFKAHQDKINEEKNQEIAKKESREIVIKSSVAKKKILKPKIK